jgi:xanthine dehydrogenase accessory factor
VDWLSVLSAFRDRGEPCVLVTVVEALGSTPREAGAKMVVSADALHGTIGGGTLELKCAEQARRLLREGADRPLLREFPLGPALGQCCGGAATVLFEPAVPARRRLWLFGAGHVGRALVDVLGDLPVAVTWIDPRADQFPDPPPAGAEIRVSALPEAEVADAPAGTPVLVMTHSHELDERVVAAALRRPDLPFVGLIGSETKRARFVRRLAAEGVPADRLVCPIGVSKGTDKRPRAVAISVAAQLLEVWDRAAAQAPAPAAPPAPEAAGRR